METLLTPTPNTIDDVFDEDTAAELFAASHNDIQISVSVVTAVSLFRVIPLSLFRLVQNGVTSLHH